MFMKGAVIKIISPKLELRSILYLSISLTLTNLAQILIKERKKIFNTIAILFFISFPFNNFGQSIPYPKSDYITGLTYNWATHIRLAPGSDNWTTTWADDDNQYSVWGDGGGFGAIGGPKDPDKVSLGAARIEGASSNYSDHCYNVYGGHDAENPAYIVGKSRGIICIGGVFYMWVGPGSYPEEFNESRLYRSTDHAATWVKNNSWAFVKSEGIIMPGFLQFGKNFANARDNYSYIYASRYISDTSQIPGKIDLMRIDKSQILNRAAYEFFKGFDLSGAPIWTSNLTLRKPVFEDANGIGRGVGVSVMYNSGLDRYILIVEHGLSNKGNIGVFEAHEPWGPWKTVAYESGFGAGHIQQTTFYWNIAPKWLSSNGKDFVMIFTGKDSLDSWNTVEASFTTNQISTCPSGIISYWKLDERSGNTYADAMGANTGIGGTVSPGPTSGRVNGGQQFNGSSSQINIAANRTLDFGSSDDFTIEYWIKRGGTLSHFETAIGRSGMDNSARWHIGLNTDGRVNYYATTGGSGTLVVGSSILTDGNWHHIAVTRTGSSGAIKLYVDGNQQGTGTRKGSFSSATSKINIGWFNGYGYYNNGSIDEAAIYKTTLSSTEIQQQYSNGLNNIGYCGGSTTQTAPIITSTAITCRAGKPAIQL